MCAAVTKKVGFISCEYYNKLFHAENLISLKIETILLYYTVLCFTVALINTAKPNLQTFVKYAKVELTPPKLSDLPEIKNEISKIVQTAKSGRWKNITVKVRFCD